jgi:hypothetical protein
MTELIELPTVGKLVATVERDMEHYTDVAEKLRAELHSCERYKRSHVRRKYDATLQVMERLNVLRWHLTGEG